MFPSFYMYNAFRPVACKLKHSRWIVSSTNTQSQVIINFINYVLNMWAGIFTFLVHQCEGTQEEGKPMSSLCLSVERKIRWQSINKTLLKDIIVSLGQKNIMTAEKLLKRYLTLQKQQFNGKSLPIKCCAKNKIFSLLWRIVLKNNYTSIKQSLTNYTSIKQSNQ